MTQKWLKFTLFFLIYLNFNLYAQEEVPQESMVDATHKQLSNSLFYLSNKLDSFFGGQRADNLPNGSRVRLFWTLNKEEGTSLKGEAAIRLNIALVETQKKLKVSFSNKYEKEFEKNQTSTVTVGPEKEKEDEKIIEKSTSSYDYKDLLHWRIRLDSGVLIDIPPDPFTRITILKSWNFGLYELRPSQQFYWYLKKGVGETTRLDLDRPITETLLFRYENEVSWMDKSDFFTFYSGPTVLQQLSENRGLSYGFKVKGLSKPTWYVDDYRLDINYRQILFRRWFFVEFNPYMHFPKVKDWKRTLGFNIHFEAVIGSY